MAISMYRATLADFPDCRVSGKETIRGAQEKLRLAGHDRNLAADNHSHRKKRKPKLRGPAHSK